MDELLKKFVANGFADFEGLQITGTVPVHQDLINEVIARVLQKESEPKTEARSGGQTTASGGGEKIPTSELAKLVKKLQVRMIEGKMVVDFEVRR